MSSVLPTQDSIFAHLSQLNMRLDLTTILSLFINKSAAVLERGVFTTQSSAMMHSRFIHSLGLMLYLHKAIFSIYADNLCYSIIQHIYEVVLHHSYIEKIEELSP
jgi:hypothetical protein